MSFRILAVLMLGLGSEIAAIDVDPAITDYQPVAALQGSLNSVGGDALNTLMTFWAEGFQTTYPSVNIQIEGMGGSTGPVALVGGTVQLAPMTREFTAHEIAAFEKKWGYPPIAIRVALDALAVFVHPDNPVPSLSLLQLDQIYSSTFKRGGADVNDWSGLGLTGDLSALPISPFGRNSASGAYAVAKQRILMGGNFKTSVLEKPGSSGVAEAVAQTRGGIGYSGAGYLTTTVRAIPVSEGVQPAVLPTYDHVLAGRYPLARFLFIYIHKKPGGDPLVAEFIRYTQSRVGQRIVCDNGFFPLSAALVGENLAKLAP